MGNPIPVNAECHIQCDMSMIQAHRRLYDFERQKAVLRERFPNWEERGARYGFDRLGDRFFNQALPQEWFELGMMFVLHEQGKL
jgi:hypothetical protein